MSKLSYQDIIKANGEATKYMGPHLAAEVVKQFNVDTPSLLPGGEYDNYQVAVTKAIEDHKAVNEKRAQELVEAGEKAAADKLAAAKKAPAVKVEDHRADKAKVSGN